MNSFYAYTSQLGIGWWDQCYSFFLTFNFYANLYPNLVIQIFTMSLILQLKLPYYYYFFLLPALNTKLSCLISVYFALKALLIVLYGLVCQNFKGGYCNICGTFFKISFSNCVIQDFAQLFCSRLPFFGQIKVKIYLCY